MVDLFEYVDSLDGAWTDSNAKGYSCSIEITLKFSNVNNFEVFLLFSKGFFWIPMSHQDPLDIFNAPIHRNLPPQQTFFSALIKSLLVMSEEITASSQWGVDQHRCSGERSEWHDRLRRNEMVRMVSMSIYMNRAMSRLGQKKLVGLSGTLLGSFPELFKTLSWGVRLDLFVF